MANKHQVLYAFTDSASYAALAKKNEYTVYFVYDTTVREDGEEVPGEYGTIYKGPTRIGSALASEIVFSEELSIHIPAESTDSESLIYTIAAGTTLRQFAADAIRLAKTWDEDLRTKLVGDGTTQHPGWIFTTIEEQLSTDEEHKGVIATAMDTRLANAVAPVSNIERDGYNGHNLITKEYVDNNFISAADFAKLQELAEILTPATVDILINAATGIQNVLKDYYTNGEVDDLLKTVDLVKTYDTSANFPVVGDASALYIDDLENIMYRWTFVEEGSSERDYIEITGDGGGSATVETHIYVKDGLTSTTIAKNTSYDVYFAFSSANTFLKYNKNTQTFEKIQQQTGTSGTVKYYLDGVQIGASNVTQANYYDDEESKNVYNKFTIPAARFTGNHHSFRVVCTDIDGNTAENTVDISIVSVTIVSSYEPVPTSLTENISIPVTVSSSNAINVYYKVDSDNAVLSTTRPGSASVYVPVVVSPTDQNGNVRSHGYHNIKIWATTYIAETGTTISTEVLSYNAIWYDVENTTPIVSATMKSTPNEEGQYEFTQYEYATLEYQIYPAGTVQLVVADDNNVETIVNTLDITTARKTWSYTFDDYGIFKMYVKVTSGNTEVTSVKYTMAVAKSEYAMEPTAGSVLFFTAKNRSNDENPTTRSIWKSEVGNYQASFNGFQWNTIAGWHKEESSGICSLRVGGGARVNIPFYPFDRDYRESGQTIEFEFETSNLSNSETTVISCFSESDNSGIIIKANGAEFYAIDFTGDNAITVPFKEDERIRISFVITPYLQDDEGRGPTDPAATVTRYNAGTGNNEQINIIESGYWRFVKIYINGIVSSITRYKSSFMQSASPAYITIGSDDATVDIYSIRAYNKVLYNKAITDNLIADTQNASEKLSLFKRNNILNESGTDVDYVALMRKVPCIFVTCESTATDPDCRNGEHILPRNKDDKRGYTVVFNADNLDDEAKTFYDFCTSFIAFNAQMTVQGTSSQYYPRKNWKLTFKPNKTYNSDWKAQVQTTKPTYLYTDDINAVLGQQSHYAKDYQLKNYGKLNPALANSSIETISSMSAKKYCLKADFAESSGTHNTGLARFVDYVLKTLGSNYLTPAQYAQYLAAGGGSTGMNRVSTRTTVDGYPIAMFWRPTSEDNYSYYGKFNFNIDKGSENVFGFIDSIKGMTNPTTGMPFVQFNESWYDIAPVEQRFEYEAPVECFEFLDNTDDVAKFKNVTDATFTDKDQEGTPSWLNAFEVRHPDNDILNDEDYPNGKIPTNWKKFCKWMTSTDRNGYHDIANKLHPIPYAWNESSNDLFAGGSSKESLIVYEGTTAEFLADNTVSINEKYILYPVNTSSADYGHVMEYIANTWVDTGEYKETQAVDFSKIYYISTSSDANYGKVYQYSTIATAWQMIDNLSSYDLAAHITYGQTTYAYDTAEYRLAKFTNELPKHMNVNMTTAYYVLTEFFAMVDQRAKNMMFASWGYEPGAENVRSADTFADEETAMAAGYKPVYGYGGTYDSSTAYRGVLYWVPAECEYIYYPIFYDNDTTMSLDNEGHIKFQPNVESTDIVGSGYAFNGTESVLWLNLKDAFADDISAVYSEMRVTALNNANCLKFFTRQQSDLWAEALYNVDAQFKYVDPATVGFTNYQYTDPSTGQLGTNFIDETYLYEAQGSREEHRKWWLHNRFIYMDSRYNTGDYKDNYVTMRIYTPRIYDPSVEPNSTFRLTPYSDMYLRVRFGSVDSFLRAEKNKEYRIVAPSLAFNDTETIIYGASSILSFGDMADKYARTAQFGNATKATNLKFGSASPYYNNNLTEFALGANNNVLKSIDVRGCNELSVIASLNTITSLTTFKATGTKMSSIEFSTQGTNLTEIEYPAALTQIKLVNMPYLTNTGIKVLDYSKISQVWIDSCPNVNTWTVLNSILSTTNNALSSARFTDINWTINTTAAYNSWKKLLTMKGITDTGYVNLDLPYLTGVVNIGENVTVSTGYKQTVETMLHDIGCELTVNVTSTSVVNGITIVGEESIATDEEYTYRIAYSPDDYIEETQKGVNWNVPSVFTVIEETPEYVTIKYVGSTSGVNQYILSATSIYNSGLTDDIMILPIATLSAIKLSDVNENELTAESIITVDEDSSILIHVGFVPEKTKDKGVTFTFTNGENAIARYEYDATTQLLMLYTKAVDADTIAYFRVNSSTVPDVRSVSPKLIVKNVVSRILTMQDANNVKLPGSARVTFINAFTGLEETETIYTATGEFSFPANSKYGTDELVLTQIKPTVAATKLFNNVGIFRWNKIDASNLTADAKETLTFYEPIECTINIWHDTTAIADASINVYSFQNESEYGLTGGSYNNVISKTVTEVSEQRCQVKIKLLANTTHDVTVTEVTSEGNPITSGNTYEALATTITTGVIDETLNIYITRDYLGNVESYGATQLHMTVKTGEQYTTARLFVKVTDTITINWGDDSTTVIDGSTASGSNTEDHSFNTELVITHAYANPSNEYDIWVHDNTANIKWFHTMRSNASAMTPCFYQGSNSGTLPIAWSANIGGLVAYQSVGEATFEKIPTFKVTTAADKQYILFASVGYIYNKFTDMTNADELFMNTKLEQIPVTSIFKNNRSITSFNRTFKNCNLTALTNGFFANNTKAVSFEETFAECHNMTTIHASESTVLINLEAGREIQSLYHMFMNCDKLTDRVPALWITFYGCSKARNSQAYAGCVDAANYATIPSDWGGQGEMYYESNPKVLDYLVFAHGEGFFEFTDIIPSNNTRYKLEITKTDHWWYEGMPIIGGGYATNLASPEDTAMYAIDFLEGGSATGGRYEGGRGSLMNRIGSPVSADFLPTTTKANDPSTPYPVSVGIDGIFTKTAGHRIVIDICKTLSGVVTMTDLANSDFNTPKTYVQGWTNDSSYGYNLPMRLFGSYDHFHTNANLDTGVDDYPDYYVPRQPDRNFSQEKFHELMIYKAGTASGIGSAYERDPEEDLIHDIVPAYGKIDDVLVPFMYDKITNKIYPYSPQHGDANVITTLDRNAAATVACATFYVK